MTKLLGNIPAANAADDFGRKKVMVAGLATLACGNLAIGWATGLHALVFARLVTGAGYGAPWPRVAWPCQSLRHSFAADTSSPRELCGVWLFRTAIRKPAACVMWGCPFRGVRNLSLALLEHTTGRLTSTAAVSNRLQGRNVRHSKYAVLHRSFHPDQPGA